MSVCIISVNYVLTDPNFPQRISDKFVFFRCLPFRTAGKTFCGEVCQAQHWSKPWVSPGSLYVRWNLRSKESSVYIQPLAKKCFCGYHLIWLLDLVWETYWVCIPAGKLIPTSGIKFHRWQSLRLNLSSSTWCRSMLQLSLLRTLKGAAIPGFRETRSINSNNGCCPDQISWWWSR